MVTVFKQTLAPYTTPIYAALEGVALGGISVVFEARYPGIVSQAVFLTFGTLGALLMAYRSGVVKATENFKLGVVAATGGIALLYFLSFILGFFGMSVPLIHSSGTFGILFSLFVVVIAALNLVLDFDFIEKGVERGAPKHMEWYGAFGLLVTLVWLYLEILHLLAKLQSRNAEHSRIGPTPRARSAPLVNSPGPIRSDSCCARFDDAVSLRPRRFSSPPRLESGPGRGRQDLIV